MEVQFQMVWFLFMVIVFEGIGTGSVFLGKISDIKFFVNFTNSANSRRGLSYKKRPSQQIKLCVNVVCVHGELGGFNSGFRIRIDLMRIRIRIQHFF
jgi:hypothetical protein